MLTLFSSHILFNTYQITPYEIWQKDDMREYLLFYFPAESAPYWSDQSFWMLIIFRILRLTHGSHTIIMKMTCWWFVDEMCLTCGCHMSDMWLTHGWYVADILLNFSKLFPILCFPFLGKYISQTNSYACIYIVINPSFIVSCLLLWMG